MRIDIASAGAAIAMAMSISGASAFGGVGIGGGTPDAQNGAQGRNNPTSYRGLPFVPAHDGYGYAQRPAYVPYDRYGDVRPYPYSYGR